MLRWWPRRACHDSGTRYFPSYLKLKAGTLESRRLLHVDGRQRLSCFWAPTSTGNKADADDKGAAKDGSHSLLRQAGFLRMTSAGIFHILPLGLRVQDKLERLMDKHMQTIGATKLSLSSISSQSLWRLTGRLNDQNAEIFRLEDRKGNRLLLSPTHEEEITSLASGIINSYRDLPLRLYQISRKYRDERRPRHGLLRAREFVMKDLYTFDHSQELALRTYKAVQGVYCALFDELGIPYFVAEADSGDMGGNLSHEYLYSSPHGEDEVVVCDSCSYRANKEVATKRTLPMQERKIAHKIWYGITTDHSTLVKAYVPQQWPTNIALLKKLAPTLDAGVEDPVAVWRARLRQRQWDSAIKSAESMPTDDARPQIMHIIDHRVQPDLESEVPEDTPATNPDQKSTETPEERVISTTGDADQPLDLTGIRNGDLCGRCRGGILRVYRAIEVGHTFHLGTRYSEPLQSSVTVPGSEKLSSISSAAVKRSVPMQMGCHGIGVSRLISATASALADEKGLNWPRAIAPFEVVIVPLIVKEGVAPADLDGDVGRVYDELRRWSTLPWAGQTFPEVTPEGAGSSPPKDGEASKDLPSTLDRVSHQQPPELSLSQKSPLSQSLDVIIDDRDKPNGWKLNDADLIGYPVVVVLGREWAKRGLLEVQCRRLTLKRFVSLRNIGPTVASILGRL